MKAKKLDSKERTIITILLNADKPIPIWQLSQWAGCDSKEAGRIIFRLSKGMRIIRTENFEFYMGVDEEHLRMPAQEEEKKLFWG